VNPRLSRCPNGHQWEAPPGATPLVCPVCGRPEQARAAPEPSTAPLALGDTDQTDQPVPAIAGYEIVAELGRGGMGVVYQARQIERDRVVALKVIRKERLNHPEVVRRFRREAQAAARLSHPNIVVVHDYDHDGDTHYLAMEYVPGVTLQRLVEQSGPLPVHQACDFIRQAALGLQHASEQALVHRDVKPANLMAVTRPGEPLPPRPLVKILDMGVARLYTLRDLPEDSLSTLTRDGAVIGTPDFVAPEQLEDPHKADVRSDLYSLGCTFYYLLTGRVPFPGGTLIQKLDRQRWETPPSPDQLRAEVPAAVAAVVRRLMAKHPDDRYKSPAELIAALDQLRRTGALPRGHEPGPLVEVRRFTGHAGPVAAVAFTPDGQGAVSGGADRTLRLWRLDTGAEPLRFGESPYPVACLAVAPRGQVFAGQGAGVRVWDAATGKEVARLTGHTDAVRGLALSADGRHALTGGDDRTVRVWDAREIRRISGHRASVAGVALSPDGRLALSAGRDPALRLWEVATGRELRTFAVPRGPVLCVAFSPDGRTAASGHFDTTLRLWEVDSGRELRRFTGHKQMVARAAFAPDGRYVASAGHDGTVRVWDPESGAELWCGQGHTGPVADVTFAADGVHLLSGGFDQTVRLWRLPE
jgi:tRNA A-37 threonylcarbamoyl transferase component Bud32